MVAHPDRAVITSRSAVPFDPYLASKLHLMEDICGPVESVFTLRPAAGHRWRAERGLTRDGDQIGDQKPLPGTRNGEVRCVPVGSHGYREPMRTPSLRGTLPIQSENPDQMAIFSCSWFESRYPSSSIVECPPNSDHLAASSGGSIWRPVTGSVTRNPPQASVAEARSPRPPRRARRRGAPRLDQGRPRATDLLHRGPPPGTHRPRRAQQPRRCDTAHQGPVLGPAVPDVRHVGRLTPQEHRSPTLDRLSLRGRSMWWLGVSLRRVAHRGPATSAGDEPGCGEGCRGVADGSEIRAPRWGRPRQHDLEREREARAAELDQIQTLITARPSPAYCAPVPAGISRPGE